MAATAALGATLPFVPVSAEDRLPPNPAVHAVALKGRLGAYPHEANGRYERVRGRSQVMVGRFEVRSDRCKLIALPATTDRAGWHRTAAPAARPLRSGADTDHLVDALEIIWSKLELRLVA